MNTRQLFDDACSQISTYKHPDIDEAQKMLHEILMAAGLGGIQHDCIERLDEYDGTIYIDTSWSARNCAQTSSYRFPSRIIDSEDPLRAAKIWGLNKKIDDATIERNRYMSLVASYEKQIAEHKAALEQA